ncbi:MAG: thiol oxidoreductase, partial [Campylobacteraceae bacterium]|nr:thiol oxidoreductase [Campylobacteraceae bacterium]
SINGTRKIAFEAKLHINYEDKEVVYDDGKKVTLRKPNYSLVDLNYGPLAKDTSISVRKAPALVGLGLLEDLSDSSILANVDEYDKNNDGISGRANLVYSIETGTYKLGRYTYKASAPSVKHQIAGAFHNDMGLTTTLFPNENCTKVQEKCLNAPKSRDAIDVPDKRLDAVTFYLTHLKVPKLKVNIKEGKELFNQIGCVSCHVSSFTTTKGTKINPYSDFLLHDMGEALSDGRSEFRASAAEWKTAPLWGINSYEKTLRKQPDYLHDGRARNLEEAILWHGGEAQASRESFMSLEENKREMIIKFIGTL